MSFLTATDSSNDWMAAVRAPLAAELVGESSRRSLKKGAWSRLLPPHKAWLRANGRLDRSDELPDPDQVFDAHPLWVVLAKSLDFF